MFTGSYLLSVTLQWLEHIRKIHGYSLAAQGGFCRHKHVDRKERVMEIGTDGKSEI